MFRLMMIKITLGVKLVMKLIKHNWIPCNKLFKITKYWIILWNKFLALVFFNYNLLYLYFITLNAFRPDAKLVVELKKLHNSSLLQLLLTKRFLLHNKISNKCENVSYDSFDLSGFVLSWLSDCNFLKLLIRPTSTESTYIRGEF